MAWKKTYWRCSFQKNISYENYLNYLFDGQNKDKCSTVKNIIIYKDKCQKNALYTNFH